MSEVLREFEAISESTGCSILLSTHIAKGGRDGASESPTSSRGAGAIGDNARWGCALTKMSRKQGQEFCDPSGPAGPGQPIAEDYPLYVNVDLHAKANFGPGGVGRWLRRDRGGVLVPARLTPFESPEKGTEGRRKAKASGVDLGPRRGLSNILGNGADAFDSRAREKEAKIFRSGTEAEIENDKSWY